MNNLKFIDIHTHGAFGFDFNYANYEQIKILLKKMYKRNIKAICPTLVGESIANIQRQLEIFTRIKKEQIANKEKEAFIVGVHLEGTFLSPNKAGIQDKTNFLALSADNFKNIAGRYEDIIKIVTLAPEEDIDLIKYLNEKNIITQAGHSVSESIKECRGVTHLFNAMPQIHHRDNSFTLQALLNDHVYCEIIADLKHVSLNALKLAFKMKSCDKILLISDSLPIAHFDNEIVFCGKKINILAQDENGTLAGSNKTLDEICNNLLNEGILTEQEILKMAFDNQIKYLNLSNTEIDILNA